MKSKTYDFLIAGSGFSGSITAMALQKSGFTVCVVEKDSHPRFTIGESSTPIADMILRDLSTKYNLPFLKNLSRYGEWQKHYPDVTCGLKRGFSYYNQIAGQPFSSGGHHENELLVAASTDDENSDTNWLRSDVDLFLINNDNKLGINYLEKSEITDIYKNKSDQSWGVEIKMPDHLLRVHANWIIDATGTPAFSNRFFKTSVSSDVFETNSAAVYSHFDHVPYWTDVLNRSSVSMDDYPYNPDHSALHHILDEGWMWMLRFNTGLLSAGFVLDRNQPGNMDEAGADETWNSLLKRYPSLQNLFAGGQLAPIPGKLIKSNRLQRKLNTVYGDGWVAMNHTAGFVDPMHSTGIAHTLSGVEKVLSIFTSGFDHEEIFKNLEILQKEVFKELQFIDLLISSVYHSRFNFKLFTAAAMLYFIASVKYEQSRLKGTIPKTFLFAGDANIFDMVHQTHQELKKIRYSSPTEEDVNRQIQAIKSRIAPYNSVGLMDPDKNNMYHHTAVSL